jgi:hypothetical protein
MPFQPARSGAMAAAAFATDGAIAAQLPYAGLPAYDR